MFSVLKKRPVAFQWPGAGCTFIELSKGFRRKKMQKKCVKKIKLILDVFLKQQMKKKMKSLFEKMENMFEK